MREDKLKYYLDMAQTAGTKSTCLRVKYGAIIVKNDEVISTGYNGSPRGCKNCDDVGQCPREVLGTHHGDAYNLCMSVHAEQNAMLAAARRDMIGASMFIVGVRPDGTYKDPFPCLLCHRMIINAGIEHVYGRSQIPDTDEYRDHELDVSTDRFIQRVRAEFDKIITTVDFDVAASLINIMDLYQEK